MPRILLIEPDRWLAGHIGDFLQAAGHSVSAFADPQAAVSAADKQRPAAVISELQLAGRSGTEFLYEFGSYSDWQTIPIIIFTNLQPRQMSFYDDVFAQLNIRACLHKSQSSLEELLGEVQAVLQPAGL